jgi:hypothetical protein
MANSDGAHIFPPRADDQRVIDAIASQGGPFGGGIDYDFRQALGIFLGFSDAEILQHSVDDMWKHYLDSEGLVNAAEPFCFSLGFQAQDADQYVHAQESAGPAPTGLPFRYDMRWHPAGTRVWFRIGGSSLPAFDNLMQFDVPIPWDLNSATWTQTGSVQLGNDADVRSISWVNNGTRLVTLNRWFSGFRRMDSFPVSSAYDITTLGAADGSFTGLIGNEFEHVWSADETKLLVQRLGGTWNRYNASVPGDISTLTGPDQTWDSAATDSQNTSSLAFSPDETKLYAIGNSTLVSWDLASAFSVSPAPSNISIGPSLNLPTTGGVWRGLNIRPDTGELFAETDQSPSFFLRSWETP